MKKIIKLTMFLILVAAVLGIRDLWQDRQTLKDSIIRMHVVGNSDSTHDQQVKLQLKDEITAYLQPIVEKFSSKEEAMKYIRENLSGIQTFSNHVLERLGVKEKAVVTLQPEAFDTRVYDTFSLPSGVYDALRVEIGEAEGRNWWCVVFPSLCVPATSTDFQDTAVSAGLSTPLSKTLTNNGKYEVRFFLLDCLGKLENLFVKIY